jgi:hypothetical protein
MRFWLLSVFLLFALIQFFQWLKDFALPFPVYVLGGALLAIASNYDKGITSFLSVKSRSETPLSQTATLIEEIKILEVEKNQKIN